MVGIIGFAAGALLAAPLTSLLASRVASADDTDVVSLRPVHDRRVRGNVQLYDVTLAADNYLTGSYDGSNFDLDTYFGPSGSDSFEVC
jgi:hypothetical protein